MRRMAAGVFGIAALTATVGAFYTESPPKYIDAAAAAGLEFRFYNSAVSRKYLLETMGGGVAVFDYDNDDCLDLVITRYMEWDFTSGGMFCGVQKPGGRAYCHPDEFQPASNYLFHNNCDGTFADVSQTSGVAAVKGKSLGLAFGDY